MHTKPSMCLDEKATSRIASGCSSCSLTDCYERRFVLKTPFAAYAPCSDIERTWSNSAAMWVQHMQKALNEMNLHLHHVLSDISGLSGLRSWMGF